MGENSTPAPGSRVLNFNFNRRDQDTYYIDGNALLRVDAKIGFQGWRLSYLEDLEGVRARVNGILAMQIMVFAIIAAFAFYLLSRASTRVSRRLRAESDGLRLLNQRASGGNIRAQEGGRRTCKWPNKALPSNPSLRPWARCRLLSAMSSTSRLPPCALIWPVPRLLLQRSRPDEAETSFQRVEDLLDRMGAITRQLKSFARKSTEDMIEVDVRTPLSAAISMMAPQFGQGNIELTQTIPDRPAMVMADPLRIEQIIVNLLRNALDAMKGVDKPHIDIILSIGDTVTLAVRDLGHGMRRSGEPF